MRIAGGLLRRVMGAAAIAGLGVLAPGWTAGAAPVASPSGAGWLTYERSNDTMAAQSSVTYSIAITFEGIPFLSGGEQSGYATSSSGYRAETLDFGRAPVDVLDSLWCEGRAYLYGNKGGLVLAGLTIQRAAEEAGKWLEAPPGGVFAQRASATLTLHGLLSPYGPSGAVQSLGPSVVDGVRADGVESAAVGGHGGTFRLWADHSAQPLPLEVKAKLVHSGSSLVSSVSFGAWNDPRSLAPPPQPVQASASWWTGVIL
jgi:hypothetical protein